MTDQELYERLKREGERWRTGGIVRSRCFGKDPDTGNSNSCISIHDPADQNPDFSAPAGMAWVKKRARECEWWPDYLVWIGFCIQGGFDSISELDEVLRQYDSAKALKEYLSEEK